MAVPAVVEEATEAEEFGSMPTMEARSLLELCRGLWELCLTSGRVCCMPFRCSPPLL